MRCERVKWPLSVFDIVPILKTTSRNRAVASLLATGVALGLCLAGCTRTVAPPTASIPSPNQPLTYPNGGTFPPGTSYGAGANPWKPSVAARQWKYIVLHHTASSGGNVESIHEEHLNRKDKSGKPWLGIGYHFVIGNGNGMGDGTIEPTFRWKQQIHGAHAGSENPDYNQHGIGVCLVGNFEQTPPTPAQRRAMKQLVQTLKNEYGISSRNVVGHRDIRQTACPGRLFPMTDVADNDVPMQLTPLAGGGVQPQLANSPGSTLR